MNDETSRHKNDDKEKRNKNKRDYEEDVNGKTERA